MGKNCIVNVNTFSQMS